MNIFFNFGERVKGYTVPVLNEREVRAGSGILLLGAMIAFMNAWLIGNYFYLKLFVITFFIDFCIRLIINPKYSPILIVGRLFVSNQHVEYTGAPQKRFAWILGLVLSSIMLIRVVILGLVGPVNLFICLLCLTFLFFEAAFGICIGCALYNVAMKDKAQYCPGGTCEVKITLPIQKITTIQYISLGFFIIVMACLTYILQIQHKNTGIDIVTGDKCDPVPQWALDIGHEEQYRLHHGCLDQ